MKNSRLAAIVLFTAMTAPLSAQAADDRMSAGIGEKLQQVTQLAQSGKYPEALKLLDQLRGMPDKSSDENTAIRQMREFVQAQMKSHPAQ